MTIAEQYKSLSKLTGLPTATLKRWDDTRPEYMALYRNAEQLSERHVPGDLLDELLRADGYPAIANTLCLPGNYFDIIGIKKTTAYDWGKLPERRSQLLMLIFGQIYSDLMSIFGSLDKYDQFLSASNLDFLDVIVILLNRKNAIVKLKESFGI